MRTWRPRRWARSTIHDANNEVSWGAINLVVVLTVLVVGTIVLSTRELRRSIRQGLPHAEPMSVDEVARNLDRFRWFRRRVPWQEWTLTRASTLPNAQQGDSISLAGTDDDRIVCLCIKDTSIPTGRVSVVGIRGGWLGGPEPLRYQVLERWLWSDGRKPIELVASRHPDDATTSADQAKMWVETAFNACELCDLPHPRFVEFADKGALFVFNLDKTLKHLDRVAKLHRLVRERDGLPGSKQIDPN